MNLLGLDLASVGNHEFDEGAAELKRMQRGGCHPVDGCEDGDGFAGAEFRYLAANVIDKLNAKPFFPPYAIRRFQGKKIGFIGMTLEGTPSIVAPAGISNLLVPRRGRDRQPLRPRAEAPPRREGDRRAAARGRLPGRARSTPTRSNACGVTGPIVDIVNHTTKAVDLFITGHTHQAYNCVIDGRPVTSASSFGRVVTDVDLTIGRNGDVKSRQRRQHRRSYRTGRDAGSRT